MRDLIKTKEKNQRSCYTYVKSGESATTVVNMGTRVDIIRRKYITSTVCTEKRMDMPLKNVISRISTGYNARTITRSVKKKRSAGRNKNITEKKRSKRVMSLKNI